MAKKRKINLASKVRKNSEERGRGAAYGYLTLPQGSKVFKVEPGSRVTLDILPYIVSDPKHPDNSDQVEINAGDIWYKRPFRLHRNVGVDKQSIVCPTSFGKRCPICNYRADRMRTGAPKTETDPLRASERNLYVVVPFDSKEFDSKPHIWDISNFCFQSMLGEELDESEENAAFANLEDGLSLKIRFSEEVIGTGKKTNKFAKVSRIDFVEREEQYDESILDKVPDLDKVLTCMDYDALEKKFLELDDGADSDSDDSEDEKPKRPAKPARSKAKKEPEPEEDEDEPEEEPEEDEDEPPKKPTRKGKTASSKEEAKPEKTGKKGKDRCPHGHKFGVDCEEHDSCDDCDIWDDCIEAKEG